MNIIDQLVDATYDTGYYSGKGEDGKPHHVAALRRRKLLNRELTDKVDALVNALSVARAALVHHVPEDCWATGPMTGDPIADLVTCPGCAAIACIDAATATPPAEVAER